MSALGRPRIEHRTPVDLVEAVRSGQVRIPAFQRPFRWDAADVVALFDSLFRGYPVGNLLFWQRPAHADQIQVGPLAIAAPELDSSDWVVDGQQRITALVGALAAPEGVNDPRFKIFFDLENGTFRSLGAAQAPPLHWLPVHRLPNTSHLLGWYRENDWLTPEQLDLADNVAKTVREYQIPTYVVTSSDEKPLRDIFDRLNNAGKGLRREEVFTALHAGLEGDEPSTLDDLAKIPAELGFGRMDERLALRSVLAYRGGDVFRDFHDEFASPTDRVETFSGVADSLRHVVRFLQNDAGIPHARLLPYSHVVPVLVRWVRLHGEPTGRLAALLRRWVWRGAISGVRVGGTSVATLRKSVTTIDGADAYASAQRLLTQVEDRPRHRMDLTAIHMRHANARINLLGLLAASPRDLATGEPVTADTLVMRPGLTQDVISSSEPLASTFANKVVRAAASSPVADLLMETHGDVAASHLVDDECLQLLREGDAPGFLGRRHNLVAGQVGRHIDFMAEWGARDQRTLADLMRTAS